MGLALTDVQNSLQLADAHAIETAWPKRRCIGWPRKVDRNSSHKGIRFSHLKMIKPQQALS